MCGIYCTNKTFDFHKVKSKMNNIKSRGPDNQQILFVDDLILAHNRLSIIDLDKRSNQPMKYANLTIVFNGEIYNFNELKNQLINKNYNFSTNSDTEVIMAMYLEYGKDCIKYFNGMFSFVIYDSPNRKLFIARDRVGQKPLYYFHRNNKIELCSQISQFEKKDLKISEESIYAFFKYKYIPEPLSIYDNIKKFPAGSFAYYDIDNSELEIQSYWSLPSNLINTDYLDIKKNLSELIKSSVGYRMISDVPIGVFLSGGIDSSLIASYAQKQSSKPIKTFCIKFDEFNHDESLYAKKISNYLGTNHTTIECDKDEIKKFIMNFNSAFDEPFADSSALPSLLLSEKTKKHVTVALSGDGGDESFLGYNRYDFFNNYSFIFNLPHKIRLLISKILNLSGNEKIKIISEILGSKNSRFFYGKIIQVLNQKYFHGNLSDSFFNHDEVLFQSNDIFTDISRFDIKTYLCDDINVKVDRSSMFSSLESRSPFLDFRVLEYANSIPVKYRFSNGNKKKILKDILLDEMPKKYFDRPKSGFKIPLDNWFRTYLKDWILDNLNDKNLKLIPNLNIDVSKKMIQNHLNNKVDKSNEIWKLMVMVNWLKNN
tara:strand:- start:1325 stop:3121 length:1797 start_codon:yes stop_codon:yes gene_type:complete